MYGAKLLHFFEIAKYSGRYFQISMNLHGILGGKVEENS